MSALTRRTALGLAAAAAWRPALAADAYPIRPVAIVVPFAAGGSADVYARLLAPRLQAALGQPFIVDDRPGAGAIIGSDYVKNAAKGVPAGIVDTLGKTLETILADPQLQAAWAKDGAVPMIMTPAAFGAYMTQDIAKWATVVKLSGAKAGE